MSETDEEEEQQQQRQALVVTELKQVLAGRRLPQPFACSSALINGGGGGIDWSVEPLMRTTSTTTSRHNDPPLVVMPSRCKSPAGKSSDVQSSYQMIDSRCSSMPSLDDPFEQVYSQWADHHPHHYHLEGAGEQAKISESRNRFSAAAPIGRYCASPVTATPVFGGGRVRHCYPETCTPNLDLDYRLALDLEKITRELSELGRNAWSEKEGRQREGFAATFRPTPPPPSQPPPPLPQQSTSSSSATTPNQSCWFIGEKPLLFHSSPPPPPPPPNFAPPAELLSIVHQVDHMGNLCPGFNKSSTSEGDCDEGEGEGNGEDRRGGGSGGGDGGDDGGGGGGGGGGGNNGHNDSSLLPSCPPRRECASAEMARFKHFVVSVWQDCEHLHHLDVDALQTLVTFGSRGETRLRHLWQGSAKSAERHKLISYVSTFHRINGILRRELRRREEEEDGFPEEEIVEQCCFQK